MLRSFVKSSKQLDLFRRSIIARSHGFATKSSNQGNTEDSKPDVIQRFRNFLTNKDDDNIPYPFELGKPQIPDHADVVIIGGGAMGSSIAYWLKQKIYEHMTVIVIEQDPTYATASTTLSVGGVRQQFSLEENIRMSLFGAEFIRNVNDYLGIENESSIDLCFRPYGYLLLASEKGAETLSQNSALQNSMGAKNILLTPPKLKNMFPWISTEGVALGCLGLEKEGWFDPWALLCAFRKKAIHLGVHYLHGEATAFEFRKGGLIDTNTGIENEKLDSVIVQTADGEEKTIRFAKAVIAAGPYSQKVAKMAMVGLGDGDLKIALPVEPRKRFVYCFHCANGPGLNTPLTIDPTGTYFRREGLAGNYICGRSPEPNDEPPTDDLEVDYEYFNEKIWPVLANRVKAFESLKVNSAWAGYYEYNSFDANGIVGTHPKFDNLVFATGFSGHGIQQSPAVGRAVAELILESQYETIDLTRLGFDRFVENQPLREVNVV